MHVCACVCVCGRGGDIKMVNDEVGTLIWNWKCFAIFSSVARARFKLEIQPRLNWYNLGMLASTVKTLYSDGKKRWKKKTELKLGHSFTTNILWVQTKPIKSLVHLLSRGTGSKQIAILKLSTQTIIGHKNPRDLLRVLWQQTRPSAFLCVRVCVSLYVGVSVCVCVTR